MSVISKGVRVARRDIDKIISELGEIRQMLTDPHTGVPALHQIQESRHSKVLEHVTYSTTGVREENRELRRRQEKMIGDLGEVRTAVEDLRREIAQAWAHTLGLPRIPGTSVPDEQGHAAQHQTPALEPGTDVDDEQKDDAPVPDITDSHGGDQAPFDGTQGHRQQGAETAFAATEGAPAASGPRVDTTASVPPSPLVAGHAELIEPGQVPEPPPATASPGGGKGSGRDGDPYSEHLQALLRAAAVSSARLICHKDTWAFLVEQTLHHAHFRLPDHITDTADGQIDTHLSGRSLLAVLVTTQHILDNPANDDLAAWALAHAINSRTRLAVTSASGAAERSDGGDLITITLDDRPVPAGS